MALNLFARAERHPEGTAIVAPEGAFSYRDLLSASQRAARRLLGGQTDLGEARVAFLTAPTWPYPVVQWATWRAGGVAVPLATSHPEPELAYVVGDAEAEIVVADSEHRGRLEALCRRRGLRLVVAEELLEAGDEDGDGPLPSVDPDRRALIVYTSGTTSRPKGAVWSHAGLDAQLATLTDAWGWSSADRALLVLPLHHVHGLVNVLSSALWSGATCEMAARFDAGAVWRRLTSGEVSVFMAVPTIYRRLIAAWEAMPEAERRAASERVARLRLMVSGSAALPVATLERWREISGHTLLERYGMTEIGMALSNPLDGERVAGAVGRPLPGVGVRLVDDEGRPVGDEAASGAEGEIEVRGRGLFLEYWRRPEETAAAFRDDWFRTGDRARREDGVYRILGRNSVDILKSGGYKISALEIEATLGEHPAVAECAVVGVADEEWGERVAAAVVPADGSDLDAERLREWAKERLAVYKVPTRWLAVAELPRNALGKVVKPKVAALFEAERSPR